jgi:hypothetical protein
MDEYGIEWNKKYIEYDIEWDEDYRKKKKSLP